LNWRRMQQFQIGPGWLAGWLLVLMLTLLLSGCQAETTAISAADPAATLPASPTSSPIPPPVIATVFVPQGQTSFSLLSAEHAAATATADAVLNSTPTITPLPSQTSPPTATGTVVPTETPTATPMPTFTPPALPKTPEWEHYWLRRPIAEGGTVWTDKAYPYGSDKNGTLRTHHGVEFNVPAGTPILAAASGRVVVAGPDSEQRLGATTNFYGLVVVIELDSRLDGRPVYNLYGHLSEVGVVVGQHVQAQDVIALSGGSGVADGPHLHFEVRVGENSYQATRNPLLWLYPFPDRGVVAGRVTWPSGVLARNVPVSIQRIDATSAYAATTTYASDSVNGDDTWNENFALDDIVAGYYELTIGSGSNKVKVELWVYPYQTAFVEVILGN
jgi:murein DD-endopeptidase MepM/ murein hydrolase activator NlpD